jgi:nitroreductase
MNDTYQDIVGLRVVRNYTDAPIDTADLEAVLEAARWTGSSKNTQGWAFVVVEGVEDLERLATAGHYTQPVRDSDVTVCLVQAPDGNEFDIGRAAQNIMLAADTRGLGSCPITLHEAERSAEVLGLPDGHTCRYAVALGHPDLAAEEEARRARSRRGAGGRKRMADVVHRGTFGS